MLYYQVDVDTNDICDYIESAIFDGLVGKYSITWDSAMSKYNFNDDS